ncbi:MAG: flagellar hook capping protein [Thiotrichales bacterium]|nr:flagellar hook capping protein [Thiotrichales bacterium]
MADFSITTEKNGDYLKAMQQAGNSKAAAPSQVMGQQDFLRLLTIQLQNQDPSKPMDPTNFVTDLTQMSQLEATVKMNESILAMTSSFQSMQTMQAASMIGKNVQVSGNDFSHTAGTTSPFRLNLTQPLKDVSVVIGDSSGMVKQLFLDDLAAGEKGLNWDGKSENGILNPSGVYSLTAYGTDENGEIQMIETIVPSRVNAVAINSDSSVTVTLATGERVGMDKVREISG